MISFSEHYKKLEEKRKSFEKDFDDLYNKNITVESKTKSGVTKTKIQKFDQEQLKAGAKIELEHTNDLSKAINIASDHFMEFKKIVNGKITTDYYKELEKIESKLKKEDA